MGFVKSVRVTNEGIRGIIHISNPDTQMLLRDWYTEGVIEKLAGLSISVRVESSRLVDGRMQVDRIVHADSVDIVQRPAAGGKFVSIIESEVPKRESTMTTEQLITPEVKDAIAEAVAAAVQRQQRG